MHKIKSLDALRGIAALLVAIDHIILKASGCPPDSALFYFATFAGAVGVGSFFLLSGFVIFLSLEKTASLEFLWHRILRIYPVIIVAVLIRLISQVSMGQRVFDMATFKLFLSNVSLFGNLVVNIPDNIEPIVWSLSVEVKFYILMAIVARFLKAPFRVPVGPMFIAVAAGLGIAACLAPPPASPATLDWAISISSLPALFIGTVACLHYKNILSTGYSLGLGVLLLLAFSFAPVTENVSFSKNFSAWILAGILFWFCIHSYRMQMALSKPWLLLLGAISYPLYAIHTAVIEFLVWANHGSGPSALVLRGMILALFAAWGLHRLVEDPMQRWAKKRTPTKSMHMAVER